MSRKSGPSSVMHCLQGIISGRPRDYQCTDEHAALVDAQQDDGSGGAEPRPGKRVVPRMLTFSDEPAGDDTDEDTAQYTPRTLADMLATGGAPSPSGADSGTSMSDRHLAYLERKKQRKSKRNSRGSFGGSPISPGSTSTLDTHGFLSHLPEVNADIAYRYCFTVAADSDESAQHFVEAACSPEVADAMNLPTPSSSSAEEKFRSLCPVPFDNEKHPHTPQPQSGNRRLDPAKFTSDVPKMAKLIFSPLAFGGTLPVCRTRFEALSSALVCVLIVDPKDGEPSFHEQLLEYERLVDALLFVRKPLRPARAIVLAAHRLDGCEDVEPQKGHMRWTERIAEYEMCVEENLWKFGPVDFEGAKDIHAVFGTIASQRIMRSQCSHGEDSDGSQQSDPPPLYEAEADPDWDAGTIEEEPEIWMAQLGMDAFGQADDNEPVPRTHFTQQPWLSPMERGAA